MHTEVFAFMMNSTAVFGIYESRAVCLCGKKYADRNSKNRYTSFCLPPPPVNKEKSLKIFGRVRIFVGPAFEKKN